MRATMLTLGLFALAGGYYGYAHTPGIYWHYRSGGSDHSVVDLQLYFDRSFRLSCAYFDAGKLEDPTFFRGTYTEGPNTFDLNFTHLCATIHQCTDIRSKTVQQLFDSTVVNDAGAIRNKPQRIRIAKHPKALFLCDARLDKHI